jgi:hypothetical protein
LGDKTEKAEQKQTDEVVALTFALLDKRLMIPKQGRDARV